VDNSISQANSPGIKTMRSNRSSPTGQTDLAEHYVP